jgi:hypothetical protein
MNTENKKLLIEQQVNGLIYQITSLQVEISDFKKQFSQHGIFEDFSKILEFELIDQHKQNLSDLKSYLILISHEVERSK